MNVEALQETASRIALPSEAGDCNDTLQSNVTLPYLHRMNKFLKIKLDNAKRGGALLFYTYVFIIMGINMFMYKTLIYAMYV